MSRIDSTLPRKALVAWLVLTTSAMALAQTEPQSPALDSVISERLIARRAAGAKALADDLTFQQQGARNLRLFYQNLLALKHPDLSPPNKLPDNKLDTQYLTSLAAALTSKPYIWLDDHPLAVGEYATAVALRGYRMVGGVAQETGVCSGTLIARYAVLTAGHCACELGSQVRAFLNTANYRLSPGTPVDVTAVKSRVTDCSAYLAASLDKKRDLLRAAGDVAVMFLGEAAAAVNIAPAVLSDGFVSGTSYYIVGYGISDDDTSTGVRRLATIQGMGCDGPASTKYGCNPAFEFWGDGRQITGRTDRPDSCAGDSGGSVFATDGVSPARLVGVISRPVTGTTCGQGGVYVRLAPPILSWVEEQRKAGATTFPPA